MAVAEDKMTASEQRIKQYVSDHIDELINMIPDLSQYEDKIKHDSIIYYIQRLTAKGKREMDRAADESGEPIEDCKKAEDKFVLNECQMAHVLLENSRVQTAFHLAGGYFESVSQLHALSNEEEYLEYREHVAIIIMIYKRKSTRCC